MYILFIYQKKALSCYSLFEDNPEINKTGPIYFSLILYHFQNSLGTPVNCAGIGVAIWVFLLAVATALQMLILLFRPASPLSCTAWVCRGSMYLWLIRLLLCITGRRAFRLMQV